MPVPIVTMMGACLGSRAMRHPWWQSSDGIDLRQARWREKFRRGRRTTGAAQRRISGVRTIGGGDAHRVFTAAQNCSVTAALSSATSQPFVSAFSLANLCSIRRICLMAAYDFQSALDNLAAGAPQTLWAIAFCTLVLTSLRWSSTSAVKRALAYWLLAAMKSLQKAIR